MTVFVLMALIILLTIIPLEAISKYIDRKGDVVLKTFNTFKYVYIAIVALIFVLIIAFSYLHIGSQDTRHLFKNTIWPFYYAKTFNGNAIVKMEFLEEHKGRENVASIFFKTFQEYDENTKSNKAGYGGYIVGFSSVTFQNSFLKWLTPNSNWKKYTTLSFLIRGENGNEKFEFKIKDVHGYEEGFLIDNIPSDNWMNIEIKLSEKFPHIDFNLVENFSISTNDSFSGNQSKIYVSNISLWK